MTSERLANETERVTVASTPQLRRLGRLLVVASIAVIFAATLTPHAGQPENTPYCLICGSLGGVDAVLNVLLFVPLGIGLGVSRVRAVHAVLAILFLSAGIEVTQFFFISGRDGTIGDVLTNVLGGTLGFALTRWITVWRRPSRGAALALAAVWGAIWLSIQALSSYAFVPQPPVSRYYGQIARVFEHTATFGGQVLSATIDTVVVPNFGFAKTKQLHELLMHGAQVGADVIPAAPTPGIAPILRIADEQGREIVLLGQDRSDLVFGLRTSAAALRLRPPLFVLRGVFPTGSDGARMLMSDTLHLRARYTRTSVEMRADSGGIAHERHLAVYPALSWILILPAQWYIEGSRGELVLSFIWFCAALIPLGYWAMFFARPLTGGSATRRTSSILAVVLLLMLLGVGLVGVPRAFGLAQAAPGTWLAAISGLLLGAALGGTQGTEGPQQFHRGNA